MLNLLTGGVASLAVDAVVVFVGVAVGDGITATTADVGDVAVFVFVMSFVTGVVVAVAVADVIELLLSFGSEVCFISSETWERDEEKLDSGFVTKPVDKLS